MAKKKIIRTEEEIAELRAKRAEKKAMEVALNTDNNSVAKEVSINSDNKKENSKQVA